MFHVYKTAVRHVYEDVSTDMPLDMCMDMRMIKLMFI